MKEGKLNFDELRKIIIDSRRVNREEVIIRNDVGEDCAVIDFGNCEGVFSTDPITGASKNIGKLAVHINCNDIASAGGEPVAILVTILAPPSITLEEIQEVMNDISEESEKLNVEVIGGHTEVTSAVNKLVVSITVIGKNIKGTSVSTAGAKINDDIVVTKYIALEGTSILANEYEERLINILSSEEIDECKALIKHISVLKEGKIGKDMKVSSMHDITEGGVVGALFEVSMASNVGFKINKSQLPVLDVTNKICKEFSIDPLRLISSGSMLITCHNGKELVRKLEENGVKATIIGSITPKNGILIVDNKEVKLSEPREDELYNIK